MPAYSKIVEEDRLSLVGMEDKGCRDRLIKMAASGIDAARTCSPTRCRKLAASRQRGLGWTGLTGWMHLARITVIFRAADHSTVRGVEQSPRQRIGQPPGENQHQRRQWLQSPNQFMCGRNLQMQLLDGGPGCRRHASSQG